ncbi:MAG: hypothetical protein CM1200mP18_19170 [Gammaproteobacteria bacterium]|nr:MAG: hypothetical protein CM1200mP18_19170 [Gammaproteobacteria bacterium]
MSGDSPAGTVGYQYSAGRGRRPAIFALTGFVWGLQLVSDSTHQVNAFIMGPGGYHVRDFVRAGGVMTVLFLVV